MKTQRCDLGHRIILGCDRQPLREGFKASISFNLLVDLEGLMREPLEDCLSLLQSRVVRHVDDL